MTIFTGHKDPPPRSEMAAQESSATRITTSSTSKSGSRGHRHRQTDRQTERQTYPRRR